MLTVLVAQSSAQQSSVTQVLNQHFSADCTVREAKNSRDIFQHLEQEAIDILLLDMDMPGINAPDIIRFLQQHQKNQVILPIVDLNNFDHTLLEDNQAVLDYLFRPYSESELILTMEDAMQACKSAAAVHTQDSGNTSIDEISRLNVIREKIELYLQAHYTESISMQDVAQAMNYSDTHFCRLFKQCFYANFSVYLNGLRVDQAKRLLSTSNCSVKEVGVSCGYRDTSYFIRVFKRYTGMTPSDYRMYEHSMTAKKYNKS